MGGAAGGDEDSGSEHAGDAEGDEVVPLELALHVGAGPLANLVELLVGRPCHEHSFSEALRGLGEAMEEGGEVRGGHEQLFLFLFWVNYLHPCKAKALPCMPLYLIIKLGSRRCMFVVIF